MNLGRGAAAATRGSFRLVRSALMQHSLLDALREIDRCWRSVPGEAALIAPIYGRLLALQDDDHDASLTLLQHIETPDPDAAALRVRALLQLRRGEDARRELQRALANYCVDPAGILANVAAEVLQHPDTGAVGWVGIGPDLALVGELAPGASPGDLVVQIGTEPEHSAPLSTETPDSPLFTCLLRPWTPGATLQVHHRNEALIGADRLPSQFGVDGRSDSAGRRISGWARIGWQPGLVPPLRIQDESGKHHVAQTEHAPLPGARWPYQIDLRRAGLQGNRIEISVKLPDGRWQPFRTPPSCSNPPCACRGRLPEPAAIAASGPQRAA